MTTQRQAFARWQDDPSAFWLDAAAAISWYRKPSIGCDTTQSMRHGYSPEEACKKACERIVNRDREKAKTLQVGFLALNKKGEYGAYAIQKGFVFSVKSETENQILQSKYLL